MSTNASTPGASMLSSWFPSSNPAPAAQTLPPPDSSTPQTKADSADNSPKTPETAPRESTPPPTSDKNSAPPPHEDTTPPTKNDPIPLSQIVGGFVFMILAGFAIYYGWILGQFQGRQYLLYVQSFGPWLRSFFVKPTPVA